MRILQDFPFSNFQPFEFSDGVYTYQTIEHYYQSMKTTDKDKKIKIINAVTPGEAKKLGRRLKVRDDWDKIKLYVMKAGLDMKFRKGTRYHEQLLDTDGFELIEFNHWHDNYWGYCRCLKCKSKQHKNALGRIIMFIRNRWVYEYAYQQRFPLVQ